MGDQYLARGLRYKDYKNRRHPYAGSGNCFSRHLSPDPMRLSTDIIRALDLSFIVAMIWILSAKSNPSKYFCKFYVDGTMILQFVYLAILRA